jgi:hypothetical protein
VQVAVEERAALAHPVDPRTARRVRRTLRVESAAVIGDLDAQAPSRPRGVDSDGAGVRVPAGVDDRFADDSQDLGPAPAERPRRNAVADAQVDLAVRQRALHVHEPRQQFAERMVHLPAQAEVVDRHRAAATRCP